jgi:hypothetical protein
VSNPAETVQRETAAAGPAAPAGGLESRMPPILDEVLARLSHVGVEQLLKLAAEMTAARLEASPQAHLAAGPNGKN